MNNELKKEIRGYYLNNMEELITLVNDMYDFRRFNSIPYGRNKLFT